MKRVFDITAALIGLILLIPLLVIVSLMVALSPGKGIFFKQTRVGRYGRDFTLYKFRTMRPDSDKLGLLTVGGRDPRITGIGYYLRRYKLDELPQLLNVLNGSMSLVGPRPEVRKYVELYNEEQKKVLLVKPGLTDYASIAYFDENALLGASDNPEKTYVEQIMPAKLELNKKYIQSPGLLSDLKIIFLTLGRIFS